MQPDSPVSSRLQVVDALRGFAIVSIMLLHNLEHFDFYFKPEGFPTWLMAIDQHIWDSMFFLFSGKSYAIFALLFGLTFHIQSHNQAKKGKDFRGRFAWRLLLLLGFGTINSAFYEGDILSIYALIGFLIIPFAKVPNRPLFWIALFFMLQPYELIRSFYFLINPGHPHSDPLSWSYFGKMGEYITGKSLWNTLWGNLTNGKTAVFLWTWEKGRVFQTLSLFLLGMLAGRMRLFDLNAQNKGFWTRLLIGAFVSTVLLSIIQKYLDHWILDKASLEAYKTAHESWANLAFMLCWVSGFILVFQNRWFHSMLRHLSPMGRMSLSNYMMQSIVGACIYYGFGFALYRFTGATFSLIIGIVLAIGQGYFSAWWMSRHPQGPLETLWHKATWIRSE